MKKILASLMVVGLFAAAGCGAYGYTPCTSCKTVNPCPTNTCGSITLINAPVPTKTLPADAPAAAEKAEAPAEAAAPAEEEAK